MPGSKGLVVFDPNGVNPYAQEVSRICEQVGYNVILLTTRTTTEIADITSYRPVLGQSRAIDGLCLHLVLRLIGPVRLLVTGFRVKRVLVCWNRDLLDRLVTLILCALGIRVYYVFHNPIASRRDGGVAGRLDDQIVRRCSRLAVHSARLAALVSRPAFVVNHPSYLAWASTFFSHRTPIGGRFVFIGNVREDKGATDLLTVADLLQEEERLVVCGTSGEFRCLEDNPRIEVLGKRGVHVTDHDLGMELGNCQAVVAPYRVVTTSGSLILAQSCNVPVVAYGGEGTLEEAGITVTRPDPGHLLAAARLVGDDFPAERVENRGSWLEFLEAKDGER